MTAGPALSVRAYGDRALLIECPATDTATDAVLALDRAVRAAGWPEVIDVVPGARTVLLTLRSAGLQAAVRSRLDALDPGAVPIGANPGAVPTGTDPGAVPTGTDPGAVVIDVVYDGADLAAVAERLAMTQADVIAAHTGTPWRAGFVGFAPGFAYLVGGDPRLRVPRREDPRTRVPAGSVALAGEFSGIYPRESPGGWQLIGRTDAALWDADRAEPALLRPGMTVHFRALR